MSSTNRGAQRIEQDKYMTPAATVDSLLDVLNLRVMSGCEFLEPCLGEGAIYNRVEARSKTFCELSLGIDYLEQSDEPCVDVIITNPPFSLALEFLEKSMAEASSVIYLLRLNFLGSKKRKDFWNAYPPSHVLVLSERPKFIATCTTKGCGHTAPPGTKTCAQCFGKMRTGSDSPEYAWFCWDELGLVNLPKGIHVL